MSKSLSAAKRVLCQTERVTNLSSFLRSPENDDFFPLLLLLRSLDPSLFLRETCCSLFFVVGSTTRWNSTEREWRQKKAMWWGEKALVIGVPYIQKMLGIYAKKYYWNARLWLNNELSMMLTNPWCQKKDLLVMMQETCVAVSLRSELID